MPAAAGPVLALDIGGTKIAAGIVEPDGTVSKHHQTATPHGTSAEVLFGLVARLAVSVIKESPRTPVACGVGCGGPMDETTVSPLNIPAWRSFPLGSSLHEALAMPVAVDNDAKALALGEWRFGAARGSESFLAMVVSTGVGGGVVLDGRLLDGRLGNAGHIGHVNVEPDGRPCVCGARGCLEAEASGTAIEAMTGRDPRDASLEIRIRSGVLVGRAVGGVANLLDLDLAVVGGSVALGFGEPFYAAARGELASRARLPYSADCRLVPAGLGELAPLVGAAAVAMRRLGSELAGVNVRHVDGTRSEDHWRPLVRVSFAAIRADPRATGAIVVGMFRFARAGWWRRSPFLPIPDERYWRFRMETVYGDEHAVVTPEDLAKAARWSMRASQVRR